MRRFILVFVILLIAGSMFRLLHFWSTRSTELETFGIAEVDELIARDLSAHSNEVVKLEDKKEMPLHEFFRMLKKQFDCPENCEAYIDCESPEDDASLEVCGIEWRKKIEQSPGQDQEPNSIWTLEYQKKSGKLIPDSIYAIWRDY